MRGQFENDDLGAIIPNAAQHSHPDVQTETERGIFEKVDTELRRWSEYEKLKRGLLQEVAQ